MRPFKDAIDVYQFDYECQTLMRRITVKFYGKPKHIFSGPDHSAQSLLRREWASSLALHSNNTWTPIFPHPYITFLRNNDFHYKEFIVYKTATVYKIFIR